ncbi:MAG: hypothetical protein IJ758_04650 [Clostridia bacterium]|nr:hypothetical protein [Clostridia bacterium]
MIDDELVRYIDFSEKYLDGILEIASARFGENYITKDQIFDLAGNEMCSLAIGARDIDVLGYCLFYEENLDKASRDFKIPKEDMISVTGSDSYICHTKSMALREGVEKRGLGYNLFKRTLDKAKHLGYKIAWCPAWKRGNYIPVEKILSKCEFDFFRIVPRLWEDDKSYKCVECGGPCRCDAAVYYKILN